MKRLEVAKHLNDSEYNILLSTYAKHNRTMGLKAGANYSLSNIVKVTRGKGCLHVHYSNREWWHYTPSGDWY